MTREEIQSRLGLRDPSVFRRDILAQADEVRQTLSEGDTLVVRTGKSTAMFLDLLYELMNQEEPTLYLILAAHGNIARQLAERVREYAEALGVQNPRILGTTVYHVKSYTSPRNRQKVRVFKDHSLEEKD